MAGGMWPVVVEAEIGDLLENLFEAGWKPVRSTYLHSSFGNWLVELQRKSDIVILTKDKGQYLIDGPLEQIKQAGLWHAFPDLKTYKRDIQAFLIEFTG